MTSSLSATSAAGSSGSMDTARDLQQQVFSPLLEAARESVQSQGQVATVRSIVLKLLGAPEVFAGYDQVREVLSSGASSGSSPDWSKLLASLDLFSYGSWSDYVQEPGKYVPLTEAAKQKLCQLTVLTIVHQSCQSKQAVIPYSEFARHQLVEGNGTPMTQQEQQRALEDLLVSCLYAGAFRGQLCQKTQSLVLRAGGTGNVPPRWLSRDVSPTEGVSQLLTRLEDLEQSLHTSHSQVRELQSTQTRKMEEYAHFWKLVQERKKKNETASYLRWDGPGGGSGGDSSAGFLDASRRQKRSRGTPGVSSSGIASGA